MLKILKISSNFAASNLIYREIIGANNLNSNNMSLKKKYLASKPECKVTFKLAKDGANTYNEVSLVGDFNNWDQGKHPMKKLKSGDFTIQADNAMLIVAIPSGSTIEKNGNKIMINEIVVAYQ